jgi:hypothetical protein
MTYDILSVVHTYAAVSVDPAQELLLLLPLLLTNGAAVVAIDNGPNTLLQYTQKHVYVYLRPNHHCRAFDTYTYILLFATCYMSSFAHATITATAAGGTGNY